MSKIVPITSLRNYKEVLNDCHGGEVVYLTKNGIGKYVVMSYEDYEKERAEKKLLMKLLEAEGAVKGENDCIDIQEMREKLGLNLKE